ncbi:MAG: RNA methyltransferase [Elusimicrobiaceae bacterium]|nr:RNA methyltransferase [Elusimicrobiaceae bacterium]
MNKFTIVLVRPRDPNNIGAAARAMANFGLSELRVVEPYLPTWQIAVSAVGAQDILQNAKLFSSLPQALADCHLSIATTALKNRQLNEQIVALPQLSAWLQNYNAEKIALVFGNEKTGLSNEDIEMCTAAMHIPTTAKQPSVNLAQAVILTCYELARCQADTTPKGPKLPTFEQTELVINSLENLMTAAHFKQDFSCQQRQILVRTLFHKTRLSGNDLFFIKKLSDQLVSLLEKKP